MVLTGPGGSDQEGLGLTCFNLSLLLVDLRESRHVTVTGAYLDTLCPMVMMYLPRSCSNVGYTWSHFLAFEL